MSKKTIDIQTKKLAQLSGCIDEGRFAIPRLQREFVWDGPKAAKLFDSILCGMPIGVVMVWETPKSQRLYLRQRYNILPPYNPRNSKVWFLIDGQQRVSVIHRVAQGDCLENGNGREVNFERVVFSLEREEDGQQIRYRRPVQGRYESLCNIMHPHWSKKLGHLGKLHKGRVRKCRERLRKYPVHLMFVRGGIDVIRETFLRINTQGMKITTADAIITGAEDLDLRDIRHEVEQSVPADFGRVPEMPILFAMAAVRGATEPRGKALRTVISRLEEQARQNPSQRKALAKEWHRLVTCFGKAVDYLRAHFKVLNRDYLYSDYMVTMLALFYFWNGNGPGKKQSDQIRKWFWSTTVGSRYSGSSFNRALPDDLKFFRRLAKNPVARFSYKPDVEQADLRRSLFASRTGIASAFYCMLLRRGPVHLTVDGVSAIPLDHYTTSSNRKDRHHIFPRGLLVGLGLPAKSYNSICNICLLTADENQSIGMRRPRKYLGDLQAETTYFKSKLDRHLIPYHPNAGIWDRDIKRGFRRFMAERTDRICRELEKEAGIRLFRREK